VIRTEGVRAEGVSFGGGGSGGGGGGGGDGGVVVGGGWRFAEEVTARGADVRYLSRSPPQGCVMYLRRILRNVQGAG